MGFLQEELKSCGKQSSASSRVFILRKRKQDAAELARLLTDLFSSSTSLLLLLW